MVCNNAWVVRNVLESRMDWPALVDALATNALLYVICKSCPTLLEMVSSLSIANHCYNSGHGTARTFQLV